MTCSLTIGIAIAAIIGLIHAWRVYQNQVGRITDNPLMMKLSALYYGLWTFVLWLLCGSYLVYFWVTSTAIYAFYRLSKGGGKFLQWRRIS